VNAALRAQIETSLHLTAPQTIACSSFYEAEFPSTRNISHFNRIQSITARTVERYRTAGDGPRGGPNQSIKVGQIKLTETLQKLGAWKSALMVKRYAHFAPEQLRAAAAKLATFSSTVPENETPEAAQGID
jgi:hypothetical protein